MMMMLIIMMITSWLPWRRAVPGVTAHGG